MSNTDNSSSQTNRDKSFPQKIRDLFLGGPGNSAAAEKGNPAPPPQPDTAYLYKLAEELMPVYENISHPQEMMDQPPFRKGATYLEHLGFTPEVLILYGQGDNEMIAQMALLALSRRPADPNLKKDLLGFLDRVSIWRRYFILEALRTHTPDQEPLLGEVFLANFELDPRMQQMFLALLR